MFQDIGVSKDLNEQFKKHLTNSEPLDCKDEMQSFLLQYKMRSFVFEVLYTCRVASSGLQHPGVELGVMALPAVLHICSAIWGSKTNRLVCKSLALGPSSVFVNPWSVSSDTVGEELPKVHSLLCQQTQRPKAHLALPSVQRRTGHQLLQKPLHLTGLTRNWCIFSGFFDQKNSIS